MSGRYIPQAEAAPGAPFFVYDSLLGKNSSSHDTAESASARAYILNRFSTGACI